MKLYCCAYCQDEKGFSYLFSRIAEVHKHWKEMHSVHQKPFQFYIDQIAMCYYCQFESTFAGLNDHHSQKHEKNVFIIVNPMNNNCCGLCQYIGHDLLIHFQTQHSQIIEANLFNPIQIADNVLDALLTSPRNSSKELIDHIICDHCDGTVKASTYWTHIFEHTYEFDCSICNVSSYDVIEVALHEKHDHGIISLNDFLLDFVDLLRQQYFRTKIVFKNGLAMNNHSLLATRYSEIHYLDKLIKELTLQFSERYNNDTKMNNHNHDVNNNYQSIERNVGDTDDMSSVCSFKIDVKNTRNLTILGIPSMYDDNLNNFFLNLCIRLKSDISMDDVKRIYRTPATKQHSITVELNSFAAKERVLRSKFGKTMWLSDLVQLPPKQKSPQIFIFN